MQPPTYTRDVFLLPGYYIEKMAATLLHFYEMQCQYGYAT